MPEPSPYRAVEPEWVCLRPGCTLTADEHDLEMVMEHTYDLQEGAADGLTERVADRLGINLGSDDDDPR